MATGATFVNEEDHTLWQEQTRLFNFLKHYDLHQYYGKFVDRGVKRLTHLKDVAADEASLDEIGLCRPEKIRLRKKVKENVESFGKFKNWLRGKSSKFDDPAPEVGGPPMPEPSVRPRSAAVIPKDQIRLGEKIGEGAHGSVHRGVWADSHGSVAVAVKRLYGRQEVQTQFIKEANSMCSLDHPNIIRLYGIVLSEPLMLIEELAPLGNLHTYLHKNGQRLTLRAFHTYACQIADAMGYLEKNRIVHRDLATRNILLLQEDSVKLSDFGMARVLDEQSDVYNLSNLGARIPVAWTAIEALTRAKFSTASDVWSYGVVLWEIYSLGETPFEGLSPVEIRDMLMQGERLGRPERCPENMYTLMKSCWNLSPHDRPTFIQLYQRVTSILPTLVRAIKSHEVAEDNAYLSFKTGELIYVIDKPKPEWIFGMRADGTIGQLSSDNVTTVVAALDDIKAKVNSGKVKAAELSISDPTSVDHVVHWGRDGSMWQEQDVGLLGGSSPGSSSPGTSSKQNGQSSPGPTSPKSSYLKLFNTRSPSPSGQHSPLLVNVTSPTASCTFTTSTTNPSCQPDLQPTFSQHSTVTEPDLGGSVISYGDSNFMGAQRYVANRESLSSTDSVKQSVEGSFLRPQSPPQLQPQVSEDNSYISLSKTNLPDSDVIQRHSQIEPHQPMAVKPNPEDEYIKMGSHSVLAEKNLRAKHGYINVPSDSSSTDQNPGYAVPRTSASSGSALNGDTMPERRGSVLDDDIPRTTTRLPNPLQPLVPSTASSAVLTEVSADDAVMPHEVRFWGSSSRTLGSNKLSSSSIRDHQHSRPVVVPTRSHSQKQMTTPRNTFSPPSDVNTGRHLSQSEQSPVYPLPKPRQIKSNQPWSPSSSSNTSQSLRQHPNVLTEHSETIVTQSVPSAAIASGRVGVHGNPAFDSVRKDAEFSDSTSAIIRNALQKHSNNAEKAKIEIRVNKLMDMGIPNINEADCLRALSHCQQKTDRAAEWLLQISDDIEERAQ